MKNFLFLVLSFSWLTSLGQSPSKPKTFKKHVSYLASEKLEGRLTGTKGEQLAAEYIAKEFAKAGLKPAGENGTYFQTFSFVKSRTIGEHSSIKTVFDLKSKTQLVAMDTNLFYPISESADTAKWENVGVANVGYGYKKEDYENKGVKNKIAVITLGTPSEVSAHSEDALKLDLFQRIKLANEYGVAGIILVKPDSKFDEKPSRMLRARGSKSAVPVVFVDTLANFFKEDALVELFFVIHKDMGVGKNVVAASSYDSNKELLVFGGHYDHLGRGELGGSRSKETNIHYGADDNASGTAMVIELAHSLSATKSNNTKYNYLFIAFSGEELGLLGSAHYVANPTFSLSNARAMFNFDMVGRLDTAKRLFVSGTGTCVSFASVLNIPEDTTVLKIIPKRQGTGPTDHTNFYYKKIPVLAFFTGLHGEYHTSKDKPELLDYNGMTNIQQFVLTIVQRMQMVENATWAFTPVEEEKKQSSSSFKVTLGVMPDYSYEGRGMKISGANPGGPAEKAGMLAGDIVVKIGEHPVADIYKYMGVLGLYKKGESTTVTLLRDGKEVVLEVVF